MRCVLHHHKHFNHQCGTPSKSFFAVGPNRCDVLSLARKLNFSPAATEEAASQMIRLYDLFISSDVTLLEINPLAETPTNSVIAADAKIVFDENAAFRQEAIFQMRDESQEDSREVAASKYNLNYIGLDGNIGCMVNGAGLAMATMDIINQVPLALLAPSGCLFHMCFCRMASRPPIF
jgi:succinyl-CoA synthetase beta subunit